MKNPAISLLLILLFSISVNNLLQAQGETVEFHDIIYLKSGAVLKGSIVKETKNNEYNFVTADGNTLVISADKIDHIERIKSEKITDPVMEPLFSKVYTILEPGFMLGFEDIDTGEGVFDNSGFFPGISAVTNFMVSPQTSMGLGAGYQTYGEGSMIPIALDFRGYLGRMKVLPFAVVNLGYSFGWSDNETVDDWGGVFINPNIGVAYRLPGAGSLFIRAGYKLQRIEVKGVAEKLNAQFMTLKIGYGF